VALSLLLLFIILGSEGRVSLLEERHTHSAFTPHWKQEYNSKEELNQREQIFNLFNSLAKPHQYSR
jgi:hypothetical protein